MSQTRYCSTCGTLLSEGAAICGECGARFQASPYERRATDAPGAWSQAPRARSRDLGPAPEESAADAGIELLTPEELQPRAPGSTALRTREQYDQLMVTQPPPSQPGPGAPSGQPGGPGSPGAAGPTGPSGPPENVAAAHPELEHPVDGCVPGSPLKRFLAAFIDSVIASLTTLPLMIGLILILTQESVTLLAQILVGLGAAIPAAYTVLIIWLVGAKGFSLGKLILGLRVTRFSEAGSIGVLRSLGRWFLYAVVWVVMALSIFLDPKKHLRGFHDRAVDSVVVDVKAGRNPLLPRPDDFERASAEHYLGAPSVPVTAHENLLAEPGTAWRGDAQAEQPVSQAPASGWAPEPSASSPYAPPPPPPPMGQDVGGQPPMIGSPWSPPPAPHAAGTGTGTDDNWGPPQQPTPPPQPGPEPSAPQQPWTPPAHPAQHHASAPQQGWTPQTSAPQMPAAEPVPSPVQSNVPSELTTDAWDEGEVDEETRMVVPAEGDLGDLEQTRVSALTSTVPTLRLVADDGTERTVQKPVVIGRNPSATDQQLLFVFPDETRSVSKTHLKVDGTGQDVTVTDLGSTNGSAILREDGSRESLVPNTPTVLPTGATLAIGDRTLTVERIS